jgi:TolB-like protein
MACVHISSLRKALGDRGGERRYIETVARSGYRFIGAVRPTGSQGESRAQGWSVAVLPARPFTAEILSGRDRATGLTLAAALIDRLGTFQQIVVRPTRAVHDQANAEKNPAAIGQSLRVDAVLASTFLRAADRVQVSARLIRSKDGACLWSSDQLRPAPAPFRHPLRANSRP